MYDLRNQTHILMDHYGPFLSLLKINLTNKTSSIYKYKQQISVHVFHFEQQSLTIEKLF